MLTAAAAAAMRENVNRDAAGHFSKLPARFRFEPLCLVLRKSTGRHRVDACAFAHRADIHQLMYRLEHRRGSRAVGSVGSSQRCIETPIQSSQALLPQLISSS